MNKTIEPCVGSSILDNYSGLSDMIFDVQNIFVFLYYVYVKYELLTIYGRTYIQSISCKASLVLIIQADLSKKWYNLMITFHFPVL